MYIFIRQMYKYFHPGVTVYVNLLMTDVICRYTMWPGCRTYNISYMHLGRSHRSGCCQNSPFEMSNFEIFVGGACPHTPLNNHTPTHRSNQYHVATALCTSTIRKTGLWTYQETMQHIQNIDLSYCVYCNRKMILTLLHSVSSCN